MSKPFTPKLAGARPRLTAALDSPTLNQFTPKMLAIVKAAAAQQAQKKNAKNKTSSTLLALTGQF